MFIFHQLSRLPQTESAVNEATELPLLLLVAVLTPAHVARAAKPAFRAGVHSNLGALLHTFKNIYQDLHGQASLLLHKRSVGATRVRNE
jgi:hypothetical protein